MSLAAAYTSGPWHDFFVAATGAAAVLFGLLFVSLSVNLSQILQYPWLPGRAAETIAVLFEAMLVPLLCLIPQSRPALGTELVVVGVLGLAFALAMQLRSREQGVQRGLARFLVRVFGALAATLLVVVSGASLLAQSGGGLYWLVPALVLLLLLGVANAWVLLVEIVR
jgi:modulator of FtsH protease